MAISRREFRMILSLAVVLFILLALLGSLLSVFSRQAYIAGRDHSIQLEKEEVNRTTTSIAIYFQHYVKDLRLLIGLPEVAKYITGDLSSRDSAVVVEEYFANILSSRPEYYQARIIDSSGWEVVRVDQGRDGVITVVPQQELQDKSTRYYFSEAMSIDVGEVYSSPLDLNVEGGVTEVPYVPVLRVASPFADSVSEKIGMVMLNVYAQELLQLLGPTMYLQTRGGYRFRENPDGTTGFEEAAEVLEGKAGALSVGGNPNVLLLYETVEPIPGYWLGVVKGIDVRQMRTAYVLRTAGMVGTLLVGVILVFAATAIHYRRARKITNLQSAMIDSLAILATERDQESGRHLDRVQRYSACLGHQLGKNPDFHSVLSRSFVEDLALAGPLHDIGKVAIPDSVLLKEGALDKAEWELMKEHSRIGARIVQADIERYNLRDRYLNIARNICAHHHERFDGTGYPDGLREDGIPLEARIFAVADAYDAIRSRRPYKEALPHEEAVKRIRASAGSHFDPRIVKAFEECEQEFKQTSEQLAD